MTALPDRYTNEGDMFPSPNGNWVSYDDHLAAIAAAEAPGRGWQPIETADKDTGHCLFCGHTRHDRNVVFSGWVAVNGRFYRDTGELCWPTHWQPLPAPPADGGDT